MSPNVISKPAFSSLAPQITGCRKSMPSGLYTFDGTSRRISLEAVTAYVNVSSGRCAACMLFEVALPLFSFAIQDGESRAEGTERDLPTTAAARFEAIRLLGLSLSGDPRYFEWRGAMAIRVTAEGGTLVAVVAASITTDSDLH